MRPLTNFATKDRQPHKNRNAVDPTDPCGGLQPHLALAKIVPCMLLGSEHLLPLPSIGPAVSEVSFSDGRPAFLHLENSGVWQPRENWPRTIRRVARLHHQNKPKIIHLLNGCLNFAAVGFLRLISDFSSLLCCSVLWKHLKLPPREAAMSLAASTPTAWPMLCKSRFVTSMRTST